MSAVVDTDSDASRSSSERVAFVDFANRRAAVSAAPGNLLEEITQPILFKGHSALAAFLIALRGIAPAVLAACTLYALLRINAIEPGRAFGAMALLVAVLSVLISRPVRSTAAELLAPLWKTLATLLLQWVVLVLALLAIAYATGYRTHYPNSLLVDWLIATPVLLMIVTSGLYALARRVLCRPDNWRKVAFVGVNRTSVRLAACLRDRPEMCMSVRGFFDDRSPQRLQAAGDLKVHGRLADLPAFVRDHDIDVIFISLPVGHLRRVQDLLEELGDTTVSLYYLPDVVISNRYAARTRAIFGMPLVALRESPFHGASLLTKRLLDVVLATLGLLVLWPLLAATALGVKLSSPGPVLFRQHRYGLDGREIVIYKFRTMTVTQDYGWLTQARRDDPRVTRFGRFLRRWSLDELPQLVNVVQGRMSLVGPRPHAVAHNEEYRRLIKGYMVRHKVLPGITGLAQVNGFRGETRRLQEMRGRVYYDLEYVQHWSLLLDLKILLMTIPRLLRGDKAY